jgi:N-acetylglutamate synthase-like GNAT family acetyltransferase
MTDTYEVTSDASRMDVPAIHALLKETYWSRGIPLATLQRAICNSLCFGVFYGTRQVAFARAVTDKATFAYIADVIVDPAHRGKGLAQRMMQAVKQHPDLREVRRMMLVTRDAHGLYEKFGFKVAVSPERIMEIRLDNPYGAPST